MMTRRSKYLSGADHQNRQYCKHNDGQCNADHKNDGEIDSNIRRIFPARVAVIMLAARLAFDVSQ